MMLMRSVMMETPSMMTAVTRSVSSSVVTELSMDSKSVMTATATQVMAVMRHVLKRSAVTARSKRVRRVMMAT